MSAWPRIFAPAKINLTLRVIGRRADGYHLLDSLVAFADVGDWLAWRAGDGPAGDRLSLEITGPQANALSAEGGVNSVLRAAEHLAAAAGIVPYGTLTLEKYLPVAAGIGGGTADAAATLRLLARHWPEAAGIDLAELAPQLGADVPVCLAARPMRMRGIGEALIPISLPEIPIVLVNPGLPVATRAVFAARRRGDFSLLYSAGNLSGIEDVVAAVRTGGNDLSAPAISVAPIITRVLDALEAQPGCRVAAMSGSGGTCFGIFPDHAAAQAAAAALSARVARWWVVACRLQAGSASA